MNGSKMPMHIFFFIFGFVLLSHCPSPLLAISSSVTKSTDNSTLIFSSIVFRHGARTQIRPYPNDPWGDEKYWPVNFGQLTKVSFIIYGWMMKNVDFKFKKHLNI